MSKSGSPPLHSESLVLPVPTRLLLPHGPLKLHLSSPKYRQSLVQVSHFLLDLAQLCLGLAARQTFRTKLFRDVRLELAPQKPEVGISPDRSLTVFELAGANTLHDEVSADSI